MKQAGMADVRRAFGFGLAAALVLGVVRPVSAQMLEGTLSGRFAGLWHSQRSGDWKGANGARH